MGAWSCLGDVDVTALVAVLPYLRWPVPAAGQPGRLYPPAEADAVIAAVLAWFPGARADRDTASLARVPPGMAFPLHRDAQPEGWITLVHVPIQTNPGAWHQFDGEERVHLETGKAYRFDTSQRHAYGNDGRVARVHLLFDVMAG